MDDENLIGQTLGNYEIRGMVAAGTHNTIYEAYQPSLKRSVALRILKKSLRDDPQNVQAFAQEVELMASLEHPHIIPVHDYGTERGYSYMVYRILRGGSLTDRTRFRGLPLPEAVTILKQLSGALDYVHSKGLATGELTRANILFDEWGTPYLVNLFFSKVRRQNQGEVLAVRYMAPERWRGEPATPASDQYALGILAYLILTKVRPFMGKESEIEEKHLNEPPPPPQEHRPDIPLAVNAVLNRVLAKEPEDRYPTVMDFAREFEQATAELPKHLFISYGRPNKDYAQRLVDHLTNSGFKVWIDTRIDFGDAWFDEIEEAIKTCAAFLLVMSPDSQQSEWVRKEILLAKRYKKPIFPLLLDGEEFGIVIDIQFADVRGGEMPQTDFHRRLRRAVFGDV